MSEYLEEDYDIFGRKIEWKKCIKCGCSVWTSETDSRLIYCGGTYCLTYKAYPTNKRKKVIISDSFKWDVWERDNFTCQHCGTRRDLTVDHIYPESKGGELTMENAQTLCRSCNSKKGVKCQNNP